MNKFVIGCGYLGQRVARLWRQAGHTVYVTTRSPDRGIRFSEQGFVPVQLDITQTGPWPDLPAADTALIAVGFDRGSGASIYDVYVEGLRNLLAHLSPETRRIIYISSTGVYGQQDDSWVDEDSPCHPTRVGGKACLAAEELLRQHPVGERSVILRLAGIYGPGRVPRRDRVGQGKPLETRPDGYLNLIHVDDAGRIVLAAERSAEVPRTYAISDGKPVRRRDFYCEIARHMGVDTPAFFEPPADQVAGRRFSGSKRVSNRRMLTELDAELAYPSYREGLDAIFAVESEEPP